MSVKGGWFSLYKSHGGIIAFHHRREEKLTCCFFCNRSNHPFWSLNNLKLTWSNQLPILKPEMRYCLCWPGCAQPGRKPKAPCFKSNPGPSLPCLVLTESPVPPFPGYFPSPVVTLFSLHHQWKLTGLQSRSKTGSGQEHCANSSNIIITQLEGTEDSSLLDIPRPTCQWKQDPVTRQNERNRMVKQCNRNLVLSLPCSQAWHRAGIQQILVEWIKHIHELHKMKPNSILLTYQLL